MEADNEVEGQLAQLAHRMDCMGTEDEETLVKHFQQILAPQADLNADLCRFFLDMNNWNLQAALGSFYDYNAQQMAFQSIPSMQFMADVTIGEGESVRPNSRFVKTWRVRNPGSERWPIGCTLRHVNGELLAESDHAEVEALETGQSTDISLTMVSPSKEGIYQSRWQMCTAVGLPFGDTIWCIIVVDDSGLLDLTQRLASTSCGSGNSQPLHTASASAWSYGFSTAAQSHGDTSNDNQQNSGKMMDDSHASVGQTSQFIGSTSGAADIHQQVGVFSVAREGLVSFPILERESTDHVTATVPYNYAAIAAQIAGHSDNSSSSAVGTFDSRPVPSPPTMVESRGDKELRSASDGGAEPPLPSTTVNDMES